MNRKKKKIKSKIYLLYTEESLSKKDNILKLLISLLETFLLLPIIQTVVEMINIHISKIIILSILFIFFLLCFYIFNKKKYNFSEWVFLDDEITLLTDKRLDGETKDFVVNKFSLVIGANILVIIPFSLTFSVIIASVVSFIFTLFLDALFVNLIKFTLIVLIFKQFFEPCNNILIKYLNTEKELYD